MANITYAINGGQKSNNVVIATGSSSGADVLINIDESVITTKQQAITMIDLISQAIINRGYPE